MVYVLRRSHVVMTKNRGCQSLSRKRCLIYMQCRISAIPTVASSRVPEVSGDLDVCYDTGITSCSNKSG